MQEDNREITIIGFGGSLRKGSYNRMLLKDVQRLMPENSILEITDISKIPIYNEDADNENNINIVNFRESIKRADGFIIATPEYNYSIPGFLKNAIDSVSKPADKNPFAGKPGVIMSASMGMLGGSRAQYHLRQVLTCLDARLINRPEVFINFAPKKFDENGHLTDEMAVKFILELLNKLIQEIRLERSVQIKI
jgi:chromate reductase